MAEQRRFAGLAGRTELRAANNLGVILRRTPGSSKLRRVDFDILDAYYEGRQYDGMQDWDQPADSPEYVKIRDRKPRLTMSIARMLCSRLAAKLVGSRTFPEFKIEEDPETEELLRVIKQTSRMRGVIVEPIRRMLCTGSVLVRFAIIDGQWVVQHYLSKYCFPEFDAAGNLEFVKIQYVWEDYEDLEKDTKKPKKKWYRLDLGKDVDISYDTPDFKDGSDPEFKVEDRVEHKMGFVQAEWFKTAEQVNTIDGPSLIADILPVIDDINYSLSQSSTAIQYNQDPQLAVSNMDEEEMDEMVRSSFKAWNLGKDGDARFLETTLTGVERADEFRDKLRQGIGDVVRVIMLDPEKIVGSAQSAKAMEVLHGPLVELIEEMRPTVEKSLTQLCLKMMLVVFKQVQANAPAPVVIPPGYAPKSLNITVSWPEVFPMTMQDLQQKVQVASTASTASLVSRETLTRWLAKDFDIENIEEEIQKIADQPVINQFGAF